MKLTDRNIRLILLSIIALGALLRFLKLDFQSLWLDELYSIIPTAPTFTVADVIESSKSDQPPAFFLLIHFAFKIFGYSAIVGKAVTAVLGVLSIPAIYFLGKEIKDKETGLIAATINAVNYFSIYYSQELRFYSMAFLFTILSYLFLVRAYKHGRIYDFLAYALTTTILLYTHYYGLIILGIQGLTFLIIVFTYKTEKKKIVLGVISGILVGLSLLPWVSVILNDLQITETWLKTPKPIFLLEYMYGYLGKDALAVLMFAFLTFLFFKHFHRDSSIELRRPFLILLILWLVFSYLIPYVRSVIGTPMLHVRYTIVTLPAWMIIFALGLTYVRNFKIKRVIYVVIIIGATVNLIFVRDYYTRITKWQFREASYFVQQHNTTGEPIYSYLYWFFNFYFDKAENKAKAMPTQPPSALGDFWIIQAEFFPEEEMQREIDQFTDHTIESRQKFFRTEAIHMVRKK